MILLISLIPCFAAAQTIEDLRNDLDDIDPWERPDCSVYGSAIGVRVGDLVTIGGQLLPNETAICLGQAVLGCEELSELNYESLVNICETHLDTALQDFTVQLESRDEQIVILKDVYADALITPWYRSFTFQFTTGVLVGIGTTALVIALVK